MLVVEETARTIAERAWYWDKEDVTRRLRLLAGQIKGIEAMVDRNASCADVLTQLAAAEGAVKKVSRIVSACAVAEQVLGTIPGDKPPEDDVRHALEGLLR